MNQSAHAFLGVLSFSFLSVTLLCQYLKLACKWGGRHLNKSSLCFLQYFIFRLVSRLAKTWTQHCIFLHGKITSFLLFVFTLFAICAIEQTLLCLLRTVELMSPVSFTFIYFLNHFWKIPRESQHIIDVCTRTRVKLMSADHWLRYSVRLLSYRATLSVIHQQQVI